MKDTPFTADRLLALYDRVGEAEDAIPRLRRFVLDLAVRGKLVEQDPSDEPAAELLKRIAKEKARLVKAGEIRKPKILPPVDVLDVHIDMPIGWRCARVGELSTVITKGSTPTSYGHAYTVKGVNFIKVESIQKGRIAPDTISSFISDETNEFLSRSKLREGDLLFSIAGTIGTCALVTAEILPANTNQALAIIRGTGFVFEADFLIVALRSFVSSAIQEKARGGTMNNVSLDDIQNLIVPLPPLAEQQRIVAKVDELMALCDRLQAARARREAVRDRLTAANLARLTAPETDSETFPTHARFALQTLPTLTTRPDQIKSLRQTILNLAVRGKLVAQDPTDEPAAELLKRIAKERKFRIKSSRLVPMSNVQATSGLPYGWSEATFSDLSIFENGDRSSNYPSGSDIVGAGVPFFSTKNISDFRLNFLNLDHITEEKFASLRSGKLQDRDILITLRGSVGKFGLFRAENGIRTGFINAQLLIVRSLLPELVEFLLTFMKSDAFAAQIHTRSSGSATPQLSAGQLGHVNIPLPPLAEQHRIVAKVDSLMALCDELEASLTTATTTRSRLLEALLHEAITPSATQPTEVVE